MRKKGGSEAVHGQPQFFLETPAFECLPDFCKLPLQFATVQLFTVKEGQVLLQSASNFLAHLQLFEDVLTTSKTIYFTVSQRSVFMFAMQNGRTVLYNENDLIINEINSDCCFMATIGPGSYSMGLFAGSHKILLLALRPEWFVSIAEKLPGIWPVVEQYRSENSNYFFLPHSNIAKSIFRDLYRLDARTRIKNDRLDVEIHSFLTDCIFQYNKSILLKNKASLAYQAKIEEIKRYIKTHLASKTLDNKKELAAIFFMTEKSLLRLTRIAFGQPLHKQVIEMRMLYSIKQLLGTNKAIYDIAKEVGYDDNHYFSRAFKKHFGVSPNLIQRP